MTIRYILEGYTPEWLTTLVEAGFRVESNHSETWASSDVRLWDTNEDLPRPSSLPFKYVECREVVIGHKLPEGRGEWRNYPSNMFAIYHARDTHGEPVTYINIRATTIDHAVTIYEDIRTGEATDPVNSSYRFTQYI